MDLLKFGPFTHVQHWQAEAALKGRLTRTTDTAQVPLV